MEGDPQWLEGDPYDKVVHSRYGRMHLSYKKVGSDQIQEIIFPMSQNGSAKEPTNQGEPAHLFHLILFSCPSALILRVGLLAEGFHTQNSHSLIAP